MISNICILNHIAYLVKLVARMKNSKFAVFILLTQKILLLFFTTINKFLNCELSI